MATLRPRSERPRVGVSACLLGEAVRYDGGHKRDAFLADVLDRQVEWVRVCPEVEVGMGTPRETLSLIRDVDRVRLKTTRSGIDHTDAMESWAQARVDALAKERLSGYILKKNSPSCGLEAVQIYDMSGRLAGQGRGIFARILIRRFPELPIEDEGRLSDPDAREAFVRRVFDYWRRWYV